MVAEALYFLDAVASLFKLNSTMVVKCSAGISPEISVCARPAIVTTVIRVLRKAKPK